MITAISSNGKHLTDEQMTEWLMPSDARESNTAMQAHVAECAACAAELAGLRESLALFRQAGTTYANTAFVEAQAHRTAPGSRTLQHAVRRGSLQPAYWLAAAAMTIVAVLPIELHRQHVREQMQIAATPMTSPSVAVNPATVSQDEALLEGISQELSASIPSSMQALNKPAGSTSSVLGETAAASTGTNLVPGDSARNTQQTSSQRTN